jgi:hypothetical protein
MDILNRLLALILLSASTLIWAENMQAPHTVLHHIGGDSYDGDGNEDAYCESREERRPRYSNYHDYSDLDPREEVDYALEDESEWPSQREDYSDYLMRDKPRDW